MGKLVTIATKARFDALREASNISETSLNFILETGLLYTHNIFINGASFGTEASNYIPVKIGGVTKNLSLNGHTHSNYYDNSSDIDIGSNKIKSGTLELLKYSSDTLILGNSSIPTEFFGTLKTTKDGTKYTILDTNNFSIVNKTSTNLTLNNVALFKYGSSSFQLDYVRRYNTVETFNNLAKYTSAGTTNENSKAYGFITLSTDTGTNTYSYAQIRVSIPDNTLEFRTSSDTTWKGTLLGGTYRNITINGDTYSIVTKASSLPSIIAPTALGTSGQYLTTSDDGQSLTWRTLPTDNNTWRPIAVNGVEKRSSATNSGNLDIINGTNTTVEWTSGNKLKINAVDTWTAFVGASDSVAGTAGYISAPGKGNQGKYFRGDGTWATPTNTWNAANTSQAGYVPQLTTGGGTIATQSTEYVLTFKSGTDSAPVWRLLPANAYKDHTYTVNNSTYSIKSKIGDTTTTVSDFTANQSGNDDFTLIQGSNITFTNDTTNRTITIAGKAGTVTSVASGIGLTGGTITSTGTLKVKLKDETLNSADSSKSTSSNGGLYSVEADKSGNLAVRVPWKNSTYTGYNIDFQNNAGTIVDTFKALTSPSKTLKAGSNVEMTAANNIITISATNTWTPWKGATDSAAGTAGYMPAPTSAQRNLFLRGDGSWVSLNNYSLPTATSSTLGGIKVGSTLSISSSVLNLPTTGVTAGTYKCVTVDAYGRVTSGDNTDADTNTWRGIYVKGTSSISTGTNTKAINFAAGSNVSISFAAAGTGSGQSGNANYGTIKISATDTTYSSKAAANGGTDVSLVTTGEKYTWNNKSDLTIGTTATTAAAGNHTHTLSIAADSGTNALTLDASTKYKLTAGGKTFIFTTPPNTTYSAATSSAAGLMSSTDKTAFDANKYVSIAQYTTNAEYWHTFGKVATAGGSHVNFTGILYGIGNYATNGTCGVYLVEYRRYSTSYNPQFYVTCLIPAASISGLSFGYYDDGTYIYFGYTCKTRHRYLYLKPLTNNGVTIVDSGILTTAPEGWTAGTYKTYADLDSTQAFTNKTYNGYTLAAACAKGVTDNSSATAVTSSDTNLITGRTLYYAGYVKSSGVTSITLKAGTGISLDTNNTAITSTGTRTITNSGVRATTINGNYLRVNTNGTNKDLTIPYASSAGSIAWGNVSSKPSNLFYYRGEVAVAYVNGTYSTLDSGTYQVNMTSYTDSIIHFQNGGSASGLDIRYEYTQGANNPIQYRKTVDSNRFANTSWVYFIDSLNIGSQSVAYATNSGMVGGYGQSDFLHISGGTLTGPLACASNLYAPDGTYGINMNNSDIVGCNSIRFGDLSDDYTESLMFMRSNGNWDTFRAADGAFYWDTNNGGRLMTLSDYCLHIQGPTSGTMNYTTHNPRICFSENGTTQFVGIVYTDWDDYRNSKGLMVMDLNNDDTSNVWFEAQGCMYAANFYTTSDRNKKKNISSLSEHIRKFTLKDSNKDMYGVIALEVPEMFREGDEGNMTVNYNSILSYYIGHLENSVAGLKDAKLQLENRVKELENRIKLLEDGKNS